MKKIAYINIGLAASIESQLSEQADYSYKEISAGRRKSILPVVLTQLEAGQTLLISSLEDLSDDFNKVLRILKRANDTGVHVRTIDSRFDSEDQSVQTLLHLKTAQDSKVKKNKKSEGGGRPSLSDELICKINELCGEGKSIKEISGELGISASTIYKYRK